MVASAKNISRIELIYTVNANLILINRKKLRKNWFEIALSFQRGSEVETSESDEIEKL